MKKKNSVIHNITKISPIFKETANEKTILIEDGFWMQIWNF